jgi:hypothetical protein
MALIKINNRSSEDTAIHGRRNLIINGAMQVAQRGQSFTAQGYSLDRWYHQLSGGTSTTTQETFALGSEVAGCSKYLKQVTSTADNYCGLVYKVEDVKSLPEGKATFSFYAKGTNPAGGSYTVRIDRISRVSPLESYSGPLSSTATLTSSWQRFVYTFDVPSSSGLGTIDNTSYLYISIHQPDGDTSTAAWELNLTGVQLEVGPTATPFEHRSYGEELALCSRYYHTSFSGETTIGGSHPASYSGKVFSWCDQYGSSPDRVAFNYQWPVQMRDIPTVTMYGNAWTSARMSKYNGGASEYTIDYASGISRNGLGGYYDVAGTNGDFVVAYVEASAEL